jgi:hypothetical protein
MARYPGFIGPSYTLPNTLAADDECINWYPVKVESGTGPNDYTLEPAPGFDARLELPEAPYRGAFTLNGATFAVGGENLYEITSLFTAILRATGLSNLNNQLVNFASNGDAGHQIEMVSDSTVYCFNVLTNTLTTIADQTASDVVFQDGYFIILDPNTSTISQSELENGLVFDESAQRNDTPDKWVKMLARPKDICLFGSESTSIYYNAKNPGFVFIPNPSASIPYGTAAPESPALLGGWPIWLANDLTVRYAPGYSATRVSTFAMEWQIASYSTVLDAEGSLTHSAEGHQFYVLSFPTAGVTWVYDLTSGLWHKRGPWNGLSFGALDVWGYTKAFGQHLVGSRTTGVIYEMSQAFAVGTDGAGLRRVRRAPHLIDEMKRSTYGRLQLHMEVGLGLPSGQGSDPLAMLRWSNDGGQTWSQPLNASAGRIGEYAQRVIWRRLGSARDRVFEVSVSDPIPWRIVDAYLDVRVGTS